MKGILTEEEKDNFRSSLSSEILTPMLRILKAMAEEQQNAVLRLDLSGVSDRDLCITKARGEGAARLYNTFSSFCQKERSKG